MGIDRYNLSSKEDGLRIVLQGHQHQWTDKNMTPATQELINKIRRKDYILGVRYLNISGFRMHNYAPACFEYEVKMKRVENNSYNRRNY